MNEGLSATAHSGAARVVPGPKSKAIFDREAEAMAPGLQSIAVYSRIAVDRAKGGAVTDVDGNGFWISSPASPSAGSAIPTPTRSAARGAARRVTVGCFTTETRAKFLNLVERHCCPHGAPISSCSRAGPRRWRPPSASPRPTARIEFVSFWGGFHGKTMGVSLCSGSIARTARSCRACTFALRRLLSLPVEPQVPVVRDRLRRHLRNVLKNDTQGEVAAIIVEPMQGTAGNVGPARRVPAAVREIADESGALLIADEMITGFGRTGTMWASDQFGLKPDIVTIGKGFGGGFPLSAVARLRAHVRQALRKPAGARPATAEIRSPPPPALPPSRRSSRGAGREFAARRRAMLDALERFRTSTRSSATCADGG